MQRNFCKEAAKPVRIEVKRATLYEDIIKIYSTMPNLVYQFPLRVKFSGESAIDFGGVARDCFSGFWEQAYLKQFDGAALLAPVSHANVSMEHFGILGKVLSHGYFCCGFIPSRIAYPVLACVLLGPSVNISQDILVQSFSDFISTVDRTVIVKALQAKELSQELQESLINILSRFGCRDLPAPENLKHIISI